MDIPKYQEILDEWHAVRKSRIGGNLYLSPDGGKMAILNDTRYSVFGGGLTPTGQEKKANGEYYFLPFYFKASFEASRYEGL